LLLGVLTADSSEGEFSLEKHHWPKKRGPKFFLSLEKQILSAQGGTILEDFLAPERLWDWLRPLNLDLELDLEFHSSFRSSLGHSCAEEVQSSPENLCPQVLPGPLHFLGIPCDSSSAMSPHDR
jgi:hypothetical protein